MTYMRFNATSLPGLIGTDGPEGSRLSDGQSGFISYGPYFQAEAGRYVAGFNLRRSGPAAEGSIYMDVVSGDTVLTAAAVPQSELYEDITKLVYLTFELAEPSPSVEVRMRIDAGVFIELESLVVFRTRSRNWGGL